MPLGCLKFVSVFPRQFAYFVYGGPSEGDGIDPQALAVPSAVLTQLYNLRKLELRLQVGESTCKIECHIAVSRQSNTVSYTLADLEPSRWHMANTRCILLATHQAPVGSQCGIIEGIQQASSIFHNVAFEVRLPELSALTLNGFECDGAYLRVSLHHHQQIRYLSLANLNILAAETTFQDVIRTLEEELTSLESVHFLQIAQAHHRTVFATLGDVDDWDPFLAPFEEDEKRDFFDVLVRVPKPSRRGATLEEWERTRQKLELLLEDVQLTDRTYFPRGERKVSSWIVRNVDSFDL